MSLLRRRRTLALCALPALGLLWVPERPAPLPPLPGGAAFEWNASERFEALEHAFTQARTKPCPDEFRTRLERLRAAVADLHGELGPGDARLSRLEHDFFDTVAAAGACHDQVDDLLSLRSELRTRVKALSEQWPATQETRDRLYRLLYGSRTAIEELLLQVPEHFGHDRSAGVDEPSQAPSVEIHGVRLHSGDLLLSRGGAPTSAFIARGSDYPGSFSHVAVLHVDPKTRRPSVVEALIESGVGVSSADRYLQDEKLRILVLRLRSDLPQVADEPLLAHLAASHALASAQERHTPYDFAMDVADPSKQFCSEVASSNFRHHGVALWQQGSRFSQPGLARWMAALGVEHLETHGPSDLEYDPLLRVVVEWHPVARLFDEHVDNVVIDAMLEQAEQGAEFDYSLLGLPLARAAKGYSWLLNQFGAVGPVPEGMSATVALRARWLSSRHAELKARVLARSDEFRARNGYRPPYWRLFAFARDAATEAHWATR